MTTDSLRNLAADRSASLRLRQRRYVDHFIAPISPRFGLPVVYEATKWQAVDHKVAAGHALETASLQQRRKVVWVDRNHHIEPQIRFGGPEHKVAYLQSIHRRVQCAPFTLGH